MIQLAFLGLTITAVLYFIEEDVKWMKNKTPFGMAPYFWIRKIISSIRRDYILYRVNRIVRRNK